MTACALDPIVLEVPFQAGDRAAIVVVEEGPRVDVFAIDVAARDATPVLRSITDFAGEPELHVSAFFYGETLAELGLTAGRVEPPADGAASQGLPPYDRARETIVSFDGARPWAELRALDSVLSMLRLPAPDPCDTFELRTFDLDVPPGLAGLAPIDSTSALVATFDPVRETAGRYFRLTLAGLEPVDARLPGLVPRDVVEQDGRTFIGGFSIADFTQLIVAGTLDGGFELVQPLPQRYFWDVLAMAVPPAGSGDDAELYMLDDRGAIHALRDGAWTELGRPPGASFGQSLGALAWLSPGVLVFALEDPPGIWRIDGTTITAEPLTPPPGGLEELDTITSITVAPGFGPIAGSKAGYLLVRHERGWDVISTPALVSNAIFGLTPYHGGVLTAENRGLVRQLYPERGECTDANVFLGQEVRLDRAIPVAGGVLTAGIEVLGPTTADRRLVAGALTRQ